MTIQVSSQGGIVTISCGNETVVVAGTVIFPLPGTASAPGVIVTGAAGGVVAPTTDDKPFPIRTGPGGGGVGTFVESIVTPVVPLKLTQADLCAAFEDPLREIVTTRAVRTLAERIADYHCQIVISPGVPTSRTAAAVTDIVPFPIFHKRW